jgi:anti-sigma B factor antagonist
MAKTFIQIIPRRVGDAIWVIDIRGELNAFAEDPLMAAYSTADADCAHTILLNFSEMEYMNSSGIGLLVTLLIRISREKQRMCAYGLSEHYRQIFRITRLDEVIRLYDTEEQALQAGEIVVG